MTGETDTSEPDQFTSSRPESDTPKTRVSSPTRVIENTTDQYGTNTPQSNVQTQTVEETASKTEGKVSDVFRYDISEQHTDQYWSYGVTNIEIKSTFRYDGSSEEFDMPANRLLAIAEMAVHNISSEKGSFALPPFAFKFEGGTDYTGPEFEHPSFEHPVNVADLETVSHQHQFQASGYPVDAGDEGTVWYATTVPKSVEGSAVNAVVEGHTSSGEAFRIVWSESQ